MGREWGFGTSKVGADIKICIAVVMLLSLMLCDKAQKPALVLFSRLDTSMS